MIMTTAPRTLDEVQSGYHGPLCTGLECTAQALHEVIPHLRRAKLDGCADELERRLEHFDAETPPPYKTEGMTPDEVRAAFDRSASALASMHALLYHHVAEHCTFSGHAELLGELKNLTDEFNKHSAPRLRVLGLDYYEFKSLALEVEAKLGLDEPMPVREAHTERRRRLPKDPEKIEAALRECLDTARSLRSRIENPVRQEKLDKITGDVQEVLDHLPNGDTDTGRGKRVKALILATASILKVEKWVRQVDLLETEASVSTKQDILRQFRDLADIAQGKEPGAKR
jgi:hypothetical protein